MGMVSTGKKRFYNIDNLKALLIFTVVLGHLCEITTFNGSSVLYMLIYVFHMPAFAFCSGMFAHFNKRKILLNFVWPYLVFQTFYMLFARFILHSADTLQYTQPYWLMWYMLAMIIWECALPLFQESSRVKQFLIILAMFAVSLSIGLDQNVSYFLSLSGVLVLFPFFLLGYYFKQSRLFHILNDGSFRCSSIYRNAQVFFGILVAFVFIGLMRAREIVNPKWLYESYSYDQLNYNVGIRAVFMVCALIITSFLILVIPNIHIPLITNMGAHTLPIFLMHGFLIRLLDHYQLLDSVVLKPAVVVLLALAICVIFSNKQVAALLKPFLQLSEKTLATILKPIRIVASALSKKAHEIAVASGSLEYR